MPALCNTAACSYPCCFSHAGGHLCHYGLKPEPAVGSSPRSSAAIQLRQACGACEQHGPQPARALLLVWEVLFALGPSTAGHPAACEAVWLATAEPNVVRLAGASTHAAAPRPWQMPDPTEEAIALMREFNAAQVAAAGGTPPVQGSVDELSLVQALACNGSRLQLVYRDMAPLTSDLAGDAVTLQGALRCAQHAGSVCMVVRCRAGQQHRFAAGSGCHTAALYPTRPCCCPHPRRPRTADLRKRQPELGKLFSDASTSDTGLETSAPLVTRRQYWPLLLQDGRPAGFLMSGVEFRNQRDAVAGACCQAQGSAGSARAGAAHAAMC